MTVKISGASAATAKPRLLWICQTPNSNLDLRWLFREFEIVFEPLLDRAAQRLTNDTFESAVINLTSAASIHIEAAEAELDRILDLAREMPIVICSPNGTPDAARAYIHRGASDVLLSPLDPDRLRTALKTAVKDCSPEVADDLVCAPWRRSLIGNSPSILQLCEVIQLIAARRVTVMISGETGTGKEVVARAIHAASKRSSLPIVAVNCTALPANLVESELFGHAKGAFTGAHANRIGRFEQAHRGSIFLDEIGDLPAEAQGKLLRVLQEQEFERVGSSETVRVDVRVIAASNVDLHNAVRERRFREDLFYRLSVVPIHLPALRERREDIPLLVNHFLEKTRVSEASAPKEVSSDALDFLTNQDWPGNVRQLEHSVQKAFALSGNRRILRVSDFDGQSSVARSRIAAGASVSVAVRVTERGIDFDDVVARFELSLLNQALSLTGGNKARAADLLNIKRTTLLAKIKGFEEKTRIALKRPPQNDGEAHPATVLVLDNEGPVRKLVSKTLESNGYRVLETGSVKGALELFQCWKEQIRVVNISSEVPGCAADEFADRLQGLSPDLLALLLSNVARRSAGDPARPGREFINGPFSSEELIRSIHHLTSAARTQLAAACSI